MWGFIVGDWRWYVFGGVCLGMGVLPIRRAGSRVEAGGGGADWDMLGDVNRDMLSRES